MTLGSSSRRFVTTTNFRNISTRRCIPRDLKLQQHRYEELRYSQIMLQQSRYRPGVAQRVPGSYGSQITQQRHRIVVRLSALRTGYLYPQEMLLVLISVRV